MIATNFNVREFPTVQSVRQSLDERFPADRRQFARRKGLELLRLVLFVLGSCLQIAGKTADLLGSWMLEASRRPIAPIEPIAFSVAVDTSTPDSSVEPVEMVDSSPLEVSDTEVEVEPLDLVFAAEEVTETEVLVEKADVNQQESEIEAVENEMADGIQQSEVAEEAEELTEAAVTNESSHAEISQLLDQVLPAHVIPSSRNKHSNRNSSR